MNDFIRCNKLNKLTGVHWLKGPVDNLKIKIKLKPPEDIISLPKFEEYANETNSISLDQNVEEFSFKWQEKCFSACEIQRYKDVHNCLTENELKYYELIKTKEIMPSKVFSYIHEDYYMPLPQERKKQVSLLDSCLQRLSLDDAIGRIGDAFGGKTISERHLFKSQEDICDEYDQWVAMHVVFDNSDYHEDTLVLKQEANLLSLYHNSSRNFLVMTPDVNSLETNAYAVETNAGEPLGRQYEVTVEFGELGGGEELDTLLTNLCNKWEKKHKKLVSFVTPPVGKTLYCVTIELTSAMEFESGDLYIDYDIKLPESIQCTDTLHGRTHVSESTLSNDKHVWYFGHSIELRLELDSGIEPPPVNIYFEAISLDFWHRHRTEGYCHLPLQLSPGASTEELRCVRPDEISGAEDRRFFIGGCHLLKDIEVLSKPEFQSGEYTFTETGTIQVGHGIISQSALPSSSGTEAHYETSTASALLLGAEAALRKYKKARARLAQATNRAD